MNDLQAALDLLILKSLDQLSSMHHHGIVMHIERVSDEFESGRRLALSCTASHGA